MKTNFEIPQNLNSLIEYQDGAVVSREIVRKDTGTITLFAFDAGQGLSKHTAPFDALILGVDGKASVVVSGKSHHVKAGEMLLMPQGAPHSLITSAPFKMLLIMIRS